MSAKFFQEGYTGIMDLASLYRIAMADALGAAQLYDVVYDNNPRDASLPHLRAAVVSAQSRLDELNAEMLRAERCKVNPD